MRWYRGFFRPLQTMQGAFLFSPADIWKQTRRNDKMGVNVFDELNARGMIAQTTNAEKTRELLGGKEPVTFY